MTDNPIADHEGAAGVPVDAAETAAFDAADAAAAADLAARRREALRARARVAGDYSTDAQTALGVCNDGTPGDAGLTAEGERYADSIIAAFADDPSDVPAATMAEVYAEAQAETQQLKRRSALRYYVALDGVPFSDAQCAEYNVTPEGHIAEGGLTPAGIEFADEAAAHFDAQHERAHAGRRRGNVTGDREAQARTAASGALVDALGLRTPIRHAIRAAAQSLIEHIDAGDVEAGDPTEGGSAFPFSGVKVLGLSEVPAEVREAAAAAVRSVFGEGVEFIGDPRGEAAGGDSAARSRDEQRYRRGARPRGGERAGDEPVVDEPATDTGYYAGGAAGLAADLAGSAAGPSTEWPGPVEPSTTLPGESPAPAPSSGDDDRSAGTSPEPAATVADSPSSADNSGTSAGTD